MDLKLIAIDLDETFLRKDKTYDRDRFEVVLDALIEQGVTTAILTGNSYHKIEDYFDDHITENLYFGCDNGNYLLKNHEVIKKTSINRDTFLTIVDFINEFDGYHATASVGDKTYTDEHDPELLEFIRKYNNELVVVDSMDEMAPEDQVTKLAVFSENSLDQNKRLTRILNERFDDIHSVTSGDGWLDVYNKDGGKGSAVKYLHEKYDIKKEETMVFGDSLNDESMMVEAGYPIVVANADPDLVLSATYQVASNEDQAVLTTLEQLVETGNLEFLEEYLLHKK